ncbi:MAG: hypothetical protein AMXMBFR84_25880 [Candidatus Hydrogenedentota bacterium]
MFETPYHQRRRIQSTRRASAAAVPSADPGMAQATPSATTPPMPRQLKSTRPGGGPPVPDVTYMTRMQGVGERDALQDSASEAAMISALSPGVGPTTPGGTAMGIRRRAMQGAKAQTLTTFGVRDQLANRLEQQDERIWQRNRTLVELAIRGRLHEADNVLREKGLDLQEQRMAQDEARAQQELALRQEGMDADIQLGKDRLAFDKNREFSDALGRTVEGQRRERMSMYGKYTPESLKRYQETKDIADLEPIKGRPSKTYFTEAMNRAQKYGVDTSGFLDDEKKHTQMAKDFHKALNDIREYDPDIDDATLYREVANRLGIWKGAASAESAEESSEESIQPKKITTQMAQEALESNIRKSYPDAMVDMDTGRWYVWQDGKKYFLKEE